MSTEDRMSPQPESHSVLSDKKIPPMNLELQFETDLREAIFSDATTSRQKLLQTTASYLIAQWLILGLALAILLAWAFPSLVFHA
jgi:hypothetical protein